MAPPRARPRPRRPVREAHPHLAFAGGFTPRRRAVPPVSPRARAHARGLTYVRGGGVTSCTRLAIEKARHEPRAPLCSRPAPLSSTVFTWNGGGVWSASNILAAGVARAPWSGSAADAADPATAPTEPRLPAVLAGQTISLFGDQITLIAVPLTAVLVLHANAAQMGYLIAAELVPNLLFALHAGAWVDRRGRRRRMMIATDLGRGALIATIPLAYAFDVLTIQQLYVVAFLAGSLTVLFHVSYSALFVSIVPRESYVAANSFLAGSRAFSFVAGPSVGAILVQVLKAPFALLVDAVTFLVSALYLGSISPEEPPTEEAEKGHVVAGVRFVLGNPAMRASLLATATINLFNFIFWALFILYAVRSLHVQPGTLGLVLGAGAVGSVIGSLITTRLGRRLGIGPTFTARLHPVPCAARARPSCGRAQAVGARDALPRGVRQRARRDDPRHQRRARSSPRSSRTGCVHVSPAPTWSSTTVFGRSEH